MKKLLLTLICLCIVLAGAYGGASYWFGMQAEKQYDLLLQQISKPNHVLAENKSYERGIFSSRAITSITIKGTGSDFRFGIVNSIQHGPITYVTDPHLKGGFQPAMAVIRAGIAPGQDSGQEIKQLLEKFPELGASTSITILSLDGSGESFLEVPAFRKKLPDSEGKETEVNWGGLTSKTGFDIGLGEITGILAAPNLEIAQDGVRFQLRNLKGDFNSHPGIKGVSVGSFAISSEQVDAEERGSDPFSLEAPGLQVETGVSGETITSNLRVSFKRLSAAGETLGPFSLEFEARKLDPELIIRLQRVAAGLQAGIGSGTDDEAYQAAVNQLKELLIHMLAKSPEFELKGLNIKTSMGDLAGKAKLTFAGSSNLFANLFTLANAVSANADVTVSEKLFYHLAERSLGTALDTPGRQDGEQIDQLAGEGARNLAGWLLAQNFMIRENGSFRSSATFKSGKLTVNGKKVQVSDLLNGMAGE